MTSKEFDTDVYTKDKIYKDIMELIDNETLGTSNSKKQFRSALEGKYEFGKKALKHYDPFTEALNEVISTLQQKEEKEQNEPDENENNDNDEKDEEETKNDETKDEEKPAKKAKKSRKRKRPSSDDEEEEDQENEKENIEDPDNKMIKTDPPKKKRKMNNGEPINDEMDKKDKKKKKKKKKNKDKKKKKKKSKKNKKEKNDDDDNNDGDNDEEEENEDEDLDDNENEKENPKKKKRNKKSKKAPYEWSLKKLKKLLRVCFLANPKIYSQLKGQSNKKQVSFLKEYLTENGVEIVDLSNKAIKKIKGEFELKREMEELGITVGENNINDGDNEYNINQRPKRTRKKIVYNDTKEKEEGDEEENEDENEEESEQYIPDEIDDGDESDEGSEYEIPENEYSDNDE